MKPELINFYDNHPVAVDTATEILRGLRQKQKSISPKYFYDTHGSKLFDRICTLPEYYPTRVETQLLEQHRDDIANHVGNNTVLIELGSGSSEKVRPLLDAIEPDSYLPMDISRDHLRQSAERLAQDYPWLDIHAVCIDFTRELEAPVTGENENATVFFPGSSIGNFEPDQATALLESIADFLESDGGLLIGVDTKKDKDVLERAYNDADGVTEAFNKNILTRINNELNANFVIDNFSHSAFYNDEHGRIEMHLVSSCDQLVKINNETFGFREGESVHTENSYKYHKSEFDELAQESGFDPVNTWQDEDNLFNIHFYRKQ